MVGTRSASRASNAAASPPLQANGFFQSGQAAFLRAAVHGFTPDLCLLQSTPVSGPLPQVLFPPLAISLLSTGVVARWGGSGRCCTRRHREGLPDGPTAHKGAQRNSLAFDRKQRRATTPLSVHPPTYPTPSPAVPPLQRRVLRTRGDCRPEAQPGTGGSAGGYRRRLPWVWQHLPAAVVRRVRGLKAMLLLGVTGVHTGAGLAAGLLSSQAHPALLHACPLISCLR